MTFRESVLCGLSPARYLRSLGFKPYKWQEDFLQDEALSKQLNAARRAGKSQIVSGKPAHLARFRPGSVSIIFAPRKDQAQEDMRLVKQFIALDPEYPPITRDSETHIEVANPSGALLQSSRIIVVPATEAGARGYPNPDLIVIDEASRVEQEVILSCILPMLNGNPNCELIMISTPNGKSGNPGKYFYQKSRDPKWSRYLVVSPYRPNGPLRLEDREPEEEFRAARAKEGIKAYYSPRHKDIDEQERLFTDQGERFYRQEEMGEYVEPEDQVFGYDDIAAAFSHEGVRPLAFDPIPTVDAGKW